MSYSLTIPPRPNHTQQSLLIALIVSFILHAVFLFATRNFEITAPPLKEEPYTVELLPSRAQPARPLPEAAPMPKTPMKVQPSRRAEQAQPTPLEKQPPPEELQRPKPVEKPKPPDRRFDKDVVAVEMPPPEKQEKPPEAAYIDRYNRSVPQETRLRAPARDAMRRNLPAPAPPMPAQQAPPPAPAQPIPAPQQAPPPVPAQPLSAPQQAPPAQRPLEADRAEDAVTPRPLPKTAARPQEDQAPQAKMEAKPEAAPPAAAVREAQAEPRREAPTPTRENTPAESAAPAPLPEQVKRALDKETLESMKRLQPRPSPPQRQAAAPKTPDVLESAKSPTTRAVSPPAQPSPPPPAAPRAVAEKPPKPTPPAAPPETPKTARPAPDKMKRSTEEKGEKPPEKTMVAALAPETSPPVTGAPSAKLPAPDKPKIPSAFLRQGADKALEPSEDKKPAKPNLKVADLLGNIGAIQPPQATPSPNALPGTTDQDGNIDRGVFGPRVNMNTLSEPRYFSYFTKLKGAITRSWSYPSAAVEKAQVGEGVMTISIRRDGTLVQWDLTRTTGFTLLDDAFMRAVRNANYPPFPDEWPEPGIDLTINFRYTLGRPFFYSR